MLLPLATPTALNTLLALPISFLAVIAALILTVQPYRVVSIAALVEPSAQGVCRNLCAFLLDVCARNAPMQKVSCCTTNGFAFRAGIVRMGLRDCCGSALFMSLTAPVPLGPPTRKRIGCYGFRTGD